MLHKDAVVIDASISPRRPAPSDATAAHNMATASKAVESDSASELSVGPTWK